ncbi:MAG: aminoglycoside phosphotransferase family protein [Thermodesulfobacteriota bacterium]
MPQPALDIRIPGLVPGDGLPEGTEAWLRRVGVGGPFTFEALAGGRNNRVYRVGAGRRSYLLKHYFTHEDDSRDRLGTEFGFLSFLWKWGVRTVPRPLGCNRRLDLGLYEFITGEKIGPGEPSLDHVLEAVRFVVHINRYRDHPEAWDLPVASEAGFSLNEHIDRVERRLSDLDRVSGEDQVTAEAAAFIRNELRPAWREVETGCRQRAHRLGLDPAEVLSRKARRLSPSDFGFHNALVEPGGRLRFLDFEYAGWDDPAKLICDFFRRPGVRAPRRYVSEFVHHVSADRDEEEALRSRVRLLLPVSAVKWCGLILNDFLSAPNRRRSFARPDSLLERRRSQLDRARKYLAQVKLDMEGAADGLR